MSPIPSRVYNAAVGGHVTGADQIIDDKTGLTLDKVAGGALEEKEYTSSSNNGMGRVVLRKNIVEGVNTLTQNMINKSNTIYIIQYDFTLGEDIIVPTNSVFEFKGGSISASENNTITGNNTQINAQNVAIFKNGIIIAGTWNCYNIISDWFDDIYSNNRIKQLINLTSPNLKNVVNINSGIYECSIATNGDGVIIPNSNTELIINGTIKLLPNSLTNAYIIKLNEVENVLIHGSGIIEGDMFTHLGTDGEWGHGIFMRSTKNIRIDGITIKDCWGDCISLSSGPNDSTGTPNTNIIIENVNLYNARRCNLGLVTCKNVVIRNSHITRDLGTNSIQTNPKCCIDIEPNESLTSVKCVAENIIIENVVVESNSDNTMFNIEGSSSPDFVNNVYINNCYLHSLSSTLLFMHNVMDVVFNNCQIIGSNNQTLLYNISTNRIAFKDCNIGYDVERSGSTSLLINNDSDSLTFDTCKIECDRFLIINDNSRNTSIISCIIDAVSKLGDLKYVLMKDNKVRYSEQQLYIIGSTLVNNNFIEAELVAPLARVYNSKITGNKFTINNQAYNIFILGNENDEDTIITNNIINVVNGCMSSAKLVQLPNSVTLNVAIVGFNKLLGATLPASLYDDPNNHLTIIGDCENKQGTIRPTLVSIGFEFLDLSLNPARPIWWTGSAWVDATGTTV